MRLAKKKLIADRDKKLEEQKKYYQNKIIEYREKRIETQTRARLRGSIVRNVNQLFKRLENPTEARHIPDRLKEFTKEFLDLFDEDSILLDEGLLTAFKDTYNDLFSDENKKTETI